MTLMVDLLKGHQQEIIFGNAVCKDQLKGEVYIFTGIPLSTALT